MKRRYNFMLACLLIASLSACGKQAGTDSLADQVSEQYGQTESAEKEQPAESEIAQSEAQTENNLTGGQEQQAQGGDNAVTGDISFNFEAKTVLLNSGYEMPIYGIGTYSLTGDTCVESVTAALNSGVRLIDTAYMYHNEESVGEAFRNSGIPREEIFVITKLYPNQFSDPETAIEEALSKLDIDYIDMMLLHHPGTGDVEAYLAMEKAVADGKIRSLGLSNWYVEELEEFLPQINITPALVQNEIHPYYQENDVIPYIHSLGIVVQGWYPLGGRGYTAELLGNEVISEIAAAHGKSSAQVILRWNLQKGVVVIPGSSNPDHIQENTELFDFELTEEEMGCINALDRGEKHDWY
ncbi:MAG: aldo/keto reductase [Lachnospiraceae bacterium]|nr:aldo/keto reductase [Lachnospiraceae bacterium]